MASMDEPKVDLHHEEKNFRSNWHGNRATHEHSRCLTARKKIEKLRDKKLAFQVYATVSKSPYVETHKAVKKLGGMY